MRFTPHHVHRFSFSFLFLIIVAIAQSGCVTRTVRSGIINRWGIQVDLVREVKGFTTEPRGFEHPTIISVPRLTNILNAVEIETSSDQGGAIREPAFHPDVVERTAIAINEALAQASPDQEVGVQVIRRAMKFGILHRKYLTSFLLYVDAGHLYLRLKRVEWLVATTTAVDELPKPRRGYRPMKFRVVSGEPLFYAGPQTLEIAWRDPVFQTAFRLPGSTRGSKRRREILMESPIPKEERDAADASGIQIDELTAEQLRALADLEEDRRKGLLTETAYQRAKRELLRRR